MQRQVPIEELPVEYLSQYRQQVQADLEVLTGSLTQLRMAREKFLESKGTIDGLRKIEPGHQVMVPLTESLYVRGKLLEPSNVLVDAGTGFYVKKELSGADQMLDRKLALLRENIEKVSLAVQQKRDQLDYTNAVLQAKIQVASQQQQSRR